ncbi:glycosyltransferase [Nitrosomonas sp. Nm51]|uniref:glycosyltransferase family 4 protein n=1 Tax=Nitrosomonas sp. Nm51 TaxID=133720 RepID=UPI0015A52AF8|nr:glycosyltransferase [Nitrosomonas sp. Nm51]
MVLDIRTGSVKKNELVRKYFDTVLKIETLFFNNITIISNGLIKKLNIKKEVQILPLGAEVISPTEKIFRSCRMLYVGTLYNRNLENVIYGLAEYLSQSEAHKKVALTIVGDGLPGQLDQLIAEAKRCGISEVVEFTGVVPHDQLKPFFDSHNVGVSYIPLTSYFDSQPPTKTYEYLMSGMPVIATKTNANQLIINNDNGVLIGDSPYEVCLGIKTMLQKMNRFSSKKIRMSSQDYEWSKIVDNLYIYLCRLK